MTTEIIKYVDGHYYPQSKVTPEIRDCFEKKNNGQYQLKVVGGIFSTNRLYVFLPHNTENKYDINQNKISNLLSSIRLTKNLEENSLSPLDFDYSEQNTDLFTIIDWLVNDFVRLGIYKETKKKIHKSVKGKILWQQTINLITPLFYRNNLIYPEFYSQYQSKEDAFLTIIHKNVISDIAEKYGVFFNHFSFINNAEQLDFSNTDVLKQAKVYLTNTLYRTNIRRTKLLIQNIIKYLDHTLIGDSDFGITTRSFHVTFEKAVRKFFHDKNNDTDQGEIEKTLIKGLPKATWEFEINNHSYTNLTNKQIPDVLIKNGQKLDVYDAKYYDLKSYIMNDDKSKRYAPLDWYSVVKQFFYYESYNYSDAKLTKGKNYFVFPYSPIKSDKGYTNIGHVKIKYRDESKNEKVSTIYILLIDTYKILNNFVH